MSKLCTWLELHKTLLYQSLRPPLYETKVAVLYVAFELLESFASQNHANQLAAIHPNMSICTKIA